MFFRAIILEEDTEVDISTLEEQLTRRDRLEMLTRMFCKSFIYQARDRNAREERARRVGQPAPPPQVTLLGESRPWYQRVIRMELTAYNQKFRPTG